MNMNWDNISDAPKFSDCVKNKEIEAKIVNVYDGDTVKAIFPLNGVLYKWNCRLVGIDTPEIRTKSKIEKSYGYLVRNALRDKIMNKVVKLNCGDLDKYGRLLITINCKEDNCSVNQWLINKDYAFKYDGGKKKSWEEYLLEKSNFFT